MVNPPISMTNYKDLVLKIHPNAECKKMVSVINGTQYYILVPNDLDAIPMRFYKEPDDAWGFAYRHKGKESVCGKDTEIIMPEETPVTENQLKVHPWNAKKLKHNPPFIKIQ